MRSTLGGDYAVFWGDFHKHISEPKSNLDRIDDALADARYNIDVYAVLCYPFEWRRRGLNHGFREESLGNRPRFCEWWERIENASAEHNAPSEFVTFPAYEWHGDRQRWGDHNIVYRREGYPLDDEQDLPNLYENLRSREALALPHHTGYQVGQRGKDWSVHDSDLSPVTEVYSVHGSSEGVGTPVPMDGNPSMGPRTGGGNYVDALDRGRRVGAIASNDMGGLPGSWGRGVAGIWAPELTREAIWEALKARRTYGTTGDRMELWYEVNSNPMGSVIDGLEEVTATVDIDCPRPLDRIELIHNGRVVDTYCHQSEWWPDGSPGIYTVLVEMGWGPKEDYGDWSNRRINWSGTVSVESGDLLSVQPRFNGWNQRYERDGNACAFDLTTERDSDDYETTQGLVLTVDVDADSELRIDFGERAGLSVPFGDAFKEDALFAFIDESLNRIDREFGVSAEDLDNPDVAYHNAAKLKIHPAYPRSACAASVTFDDLPGTGDDYYYVRASQVDGQYAWTSPVWIE
jgi:hypothetical protein